MKLRNLVVLMCDSLRYDYMPDLGVKYSRAIAPSLFTPISFASFFTAMEPQHHNVRTYRDILTDSLKTIFDVDVFENTEYYDHPYDPMVRVLGFPLGKPMRELTDMEEPFLWIERLMDCHIPYGRLGHGNELPEGELSGREYIRLLKTGKINAYTEYLKGIKKMKNHIQRHLSELENAELLENTLIVICSDHGELLSRLHSDVHNWPPCKQLVEVPVCFIPEQKVNSCMRLIDVFPTALNIMGQDVKLGEGRSAMNQKGEVTGTNLAGPCLTTWRCSQEGTNPMNRPKVFLQQMLDIILPSRITFSLREHL